MKKIFLILMISLIFLTCGCDSKTNNTTNTNNTKVNEVDPNAPRKGLGPHPLDVDKLADVDITDDLKLTHIEFNVEENKSTFIASLTNVSKKTIPTSEIDVIIRNQQDGEMVTLRLFVDGLEPNMTKRFEAHVDSKLVNYKSYELKIVE